MKSVLYKAIESVFKIFGKPLTEEVFVSFIQFLKFGLVGISNTVISYVIYVICLFVFQANNWLVEIDYITAQAISFMLSVLWSFYWNNKFVFSESENGERSIWKALIKTYISYSFTGLFLNSILLVLWIQVFNISEFIAPILNLLFSVPINFLMNKFWAFKPRK